VPVFSFAETKAYLINLGKALLPGLNWSSRESSPARRAAYLAGAVAQLDSHTDTARLELHPATAPDGKPINDWGNFVGVPRKTATPARGTAAGRVRGTAGTAVASGQQLRDDVTGLIYATASSGVEPAGGFLDVDIVGVDTGDPTTAGVGSRSRLSAGAALKYIVTPPGLQTIVTLVKALDQDGSDSEPYGSYAPRVHGNFNTSTISGGSQADFVRWALAALPQNKTAYAYPNRFGRGTIDVAVFTAGQGTARSLTAGERTDTLAYIKTQTNAPFQVTGTGGELRILTTTADPQRVELRILPEALDVFQFDYVDGGGRTVASYNAGTQELQFAGGSLPATLRAGDSLILDGVLGGSGVNSQNGKPIQIKAISAVDKVILASSPATPPAANDKIYSSGPLVLPIYNAIVEHLNGGIVYAGRGRSLIPGSQAAPTVLGGPSIVGADLLAEGIGAANPGGKYGPWAGGISVTTLMAIARYQLGTRNVTVVTPAADYEAVDPQLPLDTSVINYVTPLTIIVRSA
jgi:uncharacterized phage protein gp47/JayE